MTRPRRAASPHERLVHLVTLVAVAYGVIILGVRLAPPRPGPRPAPRAVRVTVVSVSTPAAPRRAVVLAQANAKGAGRVPRSLPAAAPLPSGGAPARGLRGTRGRRTALRRHGQGPRHGLSRRGARRAFLTARRGPRPLDARLRGGTGAGLRLSVAHLVVPDSARLPPVFSSGRPVAPAGAGEAHGWPSVSARAARYARYLDLWRRRVEEVGDRLLRARGGNLRGELRLEVKLARDGAIAGVDLVRSSRDPEINALALRILHRAEPFPPIPPGVLGHHRYLRFVYVWRFAAGTARLRG